MKNLLLSVYASAADEHFSHALGKGGDVWGWAVYSVDGREYSCLPSGSGIHGFSKHILNDVGVWAAFLGQHIPEVVQFSDVGVDPGGNSCLLYTSPSPRD